MAAYDRGRVRPLILRQLDFPVICKRELNYNNSFCPNRNDYEQREHT